MKKHIKILVKGKVQGVFYRKSTQEKAQQIGITGWVKNQQDGSVYIEAEGEEKTLNDFISWCWQGPARANVTTVSVEEGVLNNYHSFDVKKD